MTLFVTIGFSQKTKDEQQVLKLNSDYDKAFVGGVIAFQEKLFAPYKGTRFQKRQRYFHLGI